MRRRTTPAESGWQSQPDRLWAEPIVFAYSLGCELGHACSWTDVYFLPATPSPPRLK